MTTSAMVLHVSVRLDNSRAKVRSRASAKDPSSAEKETNAFAKGNNNKTHWLELLFS